MSPTSKGDTKFIFVTGGVVSALGKGITAASKTGATSLTWRC